MFSKFKDDEIYFGGNTEGAVDTSGQSHSLAVIWRYKIDDDDTLTFQNTYFQKKEEYWDDNQITMTKRYYLMEEIAQHELIAIGTNLDIGTDQSVTYYTFDYFDS